MPKPSPIKWMDKDTRELKRIVKNFNAKIQRVAKKYPHLAQYQPEKIKVKEFKAFIQTKTRTDFNRIKKSIGRYSQKGKENVVTSESGLTLSKHEIKEKNIQHNTRERKKARALKLSGISRASGTMGELETNNLKPKKFSTNKTSKEWDKVSEVLEKASWENASYDNAVEYKRRYLVATANLDCSAGQELYNFIETLSPEHIAKMSMSNPYLSISFIYDDQITNETRAEVALKEWEKSVL